MYFFVLFRRFWRFFAVFELVFCVSDFLVFVFSNRWFHATCQHWVLRTLLLEFCFKFYWLIWNLVDLKFCRVQIFMKNCFVNCFYIFQKFLFQKLISNRNKTILFLFFFNFIFFIFCEFSTIFFLLFSTVCVRIRSSTFFEWWAW